MSGLGVGPGDPSRAAIRVASEHFTSGTAL